MSYHPAESRLERRLLASFIAGAAVLLLLAALTWNFSLKAVEATRFVLHTHEVIAGLQRLRGQLARAESEQRGYLISGNDSSLRRARQAMDGIHTELDRLAVQLADNPLQSSPALNMGAGGATQTSRRPAAAAAAVAPAASTWPPG